MNTQLKKLLTLLPLVALGMITNANAQFNQATIAETAAGVNPQSVANTGNDIYKINSNTFLKVSVWDDGAGNPGIIGDDGTTTATSSFTYADAYDPDISIVREYMGTDIYAVAVYFSHNQGFYYLEWFKWNAGWVSSGITSVGRTSSTVTINIDGNLLGDFVIVWDRGQGDVMTVGGHVPTSGTPTLYTTAFALNTDGKIGGNGSMPDVCLYDTLGITALATYTYIENTNRNLIIDGERWQSPGISSGFSAGNNVHTESPAPGHDFNFPRIACVDGTMGGAYDVTVVYEDYDGNNGYHDIAALNSRAGSYSFGFPIKYTNNSQAGLNGTNPLLRDYKNLKPVVTYGINGGIYIGWILDNSGNHWTVGSNPATRGLFPIMVICNNRSQPTYSNFLEVPDVPVISQAAFSIAGKFADRNLYTFWDDQTPDVYYKAVLQSNTSLRLSNQIVNADGISPNPFQNIVQLTLPANATGNYAMKLCDASGKIIYNATLPATHVNHALSGATAALPKGVYFISILSDDSHFNLTDKIVKL